MTETLSHFAIKELLTDHLGFKKLSEYQIATNLEQQLIISHPIIVPNPLTTNDIVEIIDSEHFNFIGRKDFTVNSGGIKIQIEPLEKEMEKFINFPFFLSKKNDEKKLMVNKYNIKDKIMAMYVLLDNLLVSITFVFFPR
jgi:O-succinylbenzoic acid--CoA ligase